jgi:hypothetical protein
MVHGLNCDAGECVVQGRKGQSGCGSGEREQPASQQSDSVTVLSLQCVFVLLFGQCEWCDWWVVGDGILGIMPVLYCAVYQSL